MIKDEQFHSAQLYAGYSRRYLQEKEICMRMFTLFLLPVLVVAFSCSPETPSVSQSLPTEQDKAELTVTSIEQAIVLVRQFEKQLHDRMYGKGQPQPPLASAEKSHSVVEKVVKEETYYVFDFRKPFAPIGGGYIKIFHVNKRTGEVTRGAWQLGR
jgi:hypothetical protein